jgi:hypothetical protein
MRRWDQFLESYIDEYRARGVSLHLVAYTEARLNQWGRWLEGRRPRVGIEESSSSITIGPLPYKQMQITVQELCRNSISCIQWG